MDLASPVPASLRASESLEQDTPVVPQGVVNSSTALLSQMGVSIWLDDLSRDCLDSGDLSALIRTRDVVGLTTNPTIFATAVTPRRKSPTSF